MLIADINACVCVYVYVHLLVALVMVVLVLMLVMVMAFVIAVQFNVGEAVNFAPTDWLLAGGEADRRYRSFGREAVVR